MSAKQWCFDGSARRHYRRTKRRGAMSGGAFGSGPFGSFSFGSGSALCLNEARQYALNAVNITFSVAPRAGDPGDVRDATNAANWVLAVRSPASARARLVQFVERVSARTVRVHFDGELSGDSVYRLTLASTVTTLSGGTLSLECSFVDLGTFRRARELIVAAAQRDQSADLANPFMPRDAPGPGSPLGTYQIDDVGDWATDSGRTNLRKRVFRRATTLQGQFFHLPAYGFGQTLKGLIRPDVLRKLKALAEQQIRLEPDVVSASVVVSTPTPSIVSLNIRVFDRFGQSEEMTADLRRPE